MEVNLKAPQDVGANTYKTAMKQANLAAKAGGADGAAAEIQAQAGITAPDGVNSAGQESALPPSQQLNKEDLKKITEDLSDFMRSLNTDIEFAIHEKSGRLQVRVVDTRNDKVLKEFPSEELLDTIAAIREYVGAILDKKV